MSCDGVFSQLFRKRTPLAGDVFSGMFAPSHIKGGYYAFVEKALAATGSKPAAPPTAPKGPRLFDANAPDLPPARPAVAGKPLARYKAPVARNVKPEPAPKSAEPTPTPTPEAASPGVFSRLFGRSKPASGPASGSSAKPPETATTTPAAGTSPGVFSRLFGKRSVVPKPAAAVEPSSPNEPDSASSGSPSDAPAPAPAPPATNPHIHTPQFKAWFGDWHADPANASKVVHPNTGEPLETHHIENPPAPGYAHEPTVAPKVVYHGNPRGLVTEFKKEWTEKRPDSLHYGPGFYFTEDADAADMYAHGATGSQVTGGNPAVGSYYLKAHNPFDADKDTINPAELPAVERQAIKSNMMQRAFMAGDRSDAIQIGKDFDAGHVKLKYNELTDDKGVNGYGVSKSAIAKLLQSKGHDAITVTGPDSHPSKKGANKFWIVFEPHQIKSTANEGTFDQNNPHTMKGYRPAYTKGMVEPEPIPARPVARPAKPKVSLPPNMSPTAMATAIAILHAQGKHDQAEFLTRHLPPAHGPLPHLGEPAVPYAADIEAPDANVDTPPPTAGGLPASGVPQPANPAGRGSLPPKLGPQMKAFDPTSPLDWLTNYPGAPRSPESFPVATLTVKVEEDPPHKFGCVYVLMPPAVAERITALGRQIPDYDLADDGREECIHATALYGIHSADPLPVYDILSHFRPVKLTLGAVSVFPGDEYDVVKVDVESESLRRMNLALKSLPHTNKFREYIPHVTIAYVRPGMGAVYAARFGELNIPCVAQTAVFSDASKTKHVIPLGRVVRVEKAAMSYLNSGLGGALIGPGGSLSSLTKLKRNKRMLAKVCKAALAEVGAADSLGEEEFADAFDAEEFVFGTKALGAIITKPTAPAAPKPTVTPRPAQATAPLQPKPPPAPKAGDSSSPNEPAQPATPAVHPRVKALTEAAAKIPVHDGNIVHSEQGDNGRFTQHHTLDTWGRDETGMRALAFKTSDNNKFVMRVSARDGPAPGTPIHQLDFHDQNGNFQATGKSSTAPEVFSKVAAAGHALIAKTKPPVLYFSAARDGTGANAESRQRLYGTLTKMLSSANPDYAALAVTDAGGTKSFYVVRRDKLAAMQEHLAKSGKELETVVKSYDAEEEKAFNPREPRDNFGKWAKTGRVHNPKQLSFLDGLEESEPKPVDDVSATAYNTGGVKPAVETSTMTKKEVKPVTPVKADGKWHRNEFDEHAKIVNGVTFTVGKAEEGRGWVCRRNWIAFDQFDTLSEAKNACHEPEPETPKCGPRSPGCNCMTEDPGDGFGERVVTHSLSCPMHPDHEPEDSPAKPKPVVVSPGNRLIMGTSAPSYTGGGDRAPTEFHYVSENDRWHVREGNNGTMILTDRHNSHPQSSASVQGKFVVKGKIPEVEAKIEEITADEKAAPAAGKLSKHAENLLEHLKDWKLHNGQYSITTVSGIGPQGGVKRGGQQLLKAAHELVDAGLAEWVGEPDKAIDTSRGNQTHYSTRVLKMKGGAK